MPSAKMSYEHQKVVSVPLTDEERISGNVSREHMGIAVSAMHRDGIVLLENAVDVAHIDKLNVLLLAEAEEMEKLPTTHFNENSADGKPTGNMSQGPPLEPSSMYEDIWANKPAACVLSSLLGPKPHVNYVNGNTAIGGFGGARQRVHADLCFNHGQLPFAIVANYYLVDVSAANGSTETWVASHRDTSFADHCNCPEPGEEEKPLGPNGIPEIAIKPHLLEARREYAPPIQPVVRRGSVVLRDLRLWHAGLANPSKESRIMLAFVHTPWWYDCLAKVVLPEIARPLVDQWAGRQNHPVQYDAHFVPAHLDHRKVKFNPSFSSANEGYQSMLPDLPTGFIFGGNLEDGNEVGEDTKSTS